MTTSLAKGYRAQIDGVGPKEWYEHVLAFRDVSLYQLWQHAAGRERLTGVSRLLLSHSDRIVAAVEVRLFQLPFARGGIAYALWGPLYRRQGANAPEAFKQAIRAMRHEYAIRRGMVLRISPRLLVDQDLEELFVLNDEGFLPVTRSGGMHSLVIDLSPDVEEMRRALDKKWRNCLNKAERSGLTITSGTSVGLFDKFTKVYDRMLQRKQFAPSADIAKHRRIQQELPERLKMRVVLASNEDGPCAGAIYSALGDTAVYLFGATDDVGMRTSASYLVQWQVVKELKQLGLRHYDLNGVDPKLNPGTSHFKRGLAGKQGIEVTYAGQFQVMQGSLANRSVLLVDRIRHKMRSRVAHRATAGA